MRNPNETWDDTQTRRTISLKNDLMEQAINRSEELEYNSFSEYVRWLIVNDIRYNLLDRKNLAKRELETGPILESTPFWRKKII
jgi:hypothetical protein